MRFESWRVPKVGKEDDSTQWSWRLSFWRLQIELFVYRHEYPNYPFHTKTHGDRWVFKPAIIFDRKTR